MVFHSILYKKVQSSVLNNPQFEPTFWEKWGVLIVWLSILAAIVLTITLILVVGKIRITRENRLTNIPGKEQPISCTRIRTVTLYNHSEEMLEKGEPFVAPLLERDGYIFGGWFYDTALTEPYKTTKITEDITLYPKWTKES